MADIFEQQGPCSAPLWVKANWLCLVPRHQLQPDGSLVISRVTVDDGGFYTCVAFNGQDRDQRWVQLRVLGKKIVLSRGGVGGGRGGRAMGGPVEWGRGLC